MSYQRMNVDDLMDVLSWNDSALDGWDILCSIDVRALNTVLLKEYAKFPEYSRHQFFKKKIFFKHHYEISCDLQFGQPHMKLSMAKAGTYELYMPLESPSVCNRTFDKKTEQITLPEEYSIVTSGFLNILKKFEGGEEELPFHDAMELDSEGESVSVALHFAKDIKNVMVKPPTMPANFVDVFDSIVKYFEEIKKGMHYELLKIVKNVNDAGNFTITPKSFVLTTAASENECRDGVLNVWIQTEETGNKKGNLQPSFFPDAAILPIPEGHTNTIYFSRALIEKTIIKKASEGRTIDPAEEKIPVKINFESLTNFTNNYVLLNEEIFKTPIDRAIYFPNDVVLVQDIMPRYKEMDKVTSKQKPKSICSTLDKKLLVKGKYVKLSDIPRNKCPETEEFIDVVALEKVFIDTDFIETCQNLQLSIVAPNWDVMGGRNVKLIGSFFGLGENFVDDDTLSVLTRQEDTINIIGMNGNTSITNSTLPESLMKRVPENPLEALCIYKKDTLELQNCTYPANDCESLDRTEASIINPSFAVNNFKNFARENLNDVLSDFLVRLDKDENVVNLYNTLGFINELKGLEDQYYLLQDKISMLPFYKSLIDRIYNYAVSPKDEEKSLQYKKVLSYVYSATLSKICTFNSKAETYLVIDLQKYFELMVENINALKRLSNTVAVNQHYQRYQNDIVKRSKEAESFVNDKIAPEITKVFDSLDNNIQVLVNETIALKNATIEEKKKLEEKRKKLRGSLVTRGILSGLKIVGQFLGFAGPVGSAAGAAIGGAGMIAETFALDDTSVDGKLITLPTSVKFAVTKVSDEYKYKKDTLKEQLYDMEKKIADFIKTEPDPNIKTIRNKIAEARTRLDREMDHEIMFEIKREVEQLLKDEKAAFEKIKPEIDAKIDQKIRLISHAQHLVSVTDAIVGSYSKIRGDVAKIDKLGEEISEADSKIKQLEAYQESISKIILPTCKNMRMDMDRLEKELKGKSHAALDVGKWQMQTAIRDIKLMLKKMTKDFEVQDDILRCVEKVEEGMTAMINVYDDLEDFQDKAKLAAYIADVNSERGLEIQTDNRDLNNAIDSLNVIIKANVILMQYRRVMQAFKYYIFPFAHLFLAEFNLPPELKIEDNVDNLVYNSVNKIEILKAKVKESSLVLNEYDKHVHKNIEFNSRNKIISPFVIWSYDQNKATISNLLEGKEVTIMSDITKGITKNAIKFRTIGLNFKITDNILQNEINSVLENFALTMTHLGNSYYRCDDKFFMIKGDKQTIYYHLKMKSDGRPYDTNDIYDKLENGDYILSPYTTWSIRLVNITADYGVLEKFKNVSIDLELEGKGQYVDMGIDICSSHLYQYYTQDNTIVDPYMYYYYRKANPVNLFKSVFLEKDVHNNSSFDGRIREVRAIRVSEDEYYPEEIDLERTFVASSSNSMQSPINAAINWLGDKLMKFNPFGIISNAFFDQNKQIDNVSTKTTSLQSVDFNISDVNNVLLLGDLAVRSLTKAKPYNAAEEPTNFINVKVDVMNMMEEFEEILQNLSDKYHRNDLLAEFNPVDLMTALEKEMINGNYTNVADVFHRSVFNEVLEEHNELNVEFYKNVNEVMEKHKSAFLFPHAEVMDLKNIATAEIVGSTYY